MAIFYRLTYYSGQLRPDGNIHPSNPTITVSNSTLEVNSGNINGVWRTIYSNNKGIININGGTIKCEGDTTGNIAVYSENQSTVTVNGGKVVSKTNAPEGNKNGNSGKETWLFVVNTSSNITINDGNFEVGGNSLGGMRAFLYGSGTVTVTLNDGNYLVTHEIVEGVNDSSYPECYSIFCIF